MRMFSGSDDFSADDIAEMRTFHMPHRVQSIGGKLCAGDKIYFQHFGNSTGKCPECEEGRIYEDFDGIKRHCYKKCKYCHGTAITNKLGKGQIVEWEIAAIIARADIPNKYLLHLFRNQETRDIFVTDYLRIEPYKEFYAEERCFISKAEAQRSLLKYGGAC